MAVINYRNSTDDGWISVSGYLTEHNIVFFVGGDLVLGEHPAVIGNIFDYDITITKLRGYVRTAPQGSGISIDVLINGVSILDSYYYISPSNQNGGVSFDVSGFGILTQNDDITIEIIAVGSSVAGSNLTFQIGGNVT